MNMTFCPDAVLAELLALAQADDAAALRRLDEAIEAYTDARLLFLKGSLLAGLQRYEEARRDMQMAIALAPGFDLARFQLGFLEMTSGLLHAAASTWGPLELLARDHPFRLMSSGLIALARDSWVEAEALLLEGIARNREHPLINDDMQLIIDEIRARPVQSSAAADEAPASAVDLLLRQSGLRAQAGETRH
jgi:tetratricopeptide (TPR) repeat protein